MKITIQENRQAYLFTPETPKEHIVMTNIVEYLKSNEDGISALSAVEASASHVQVSECEFVKIQP